MLELTLSSAVEETLKRLLAEDDEYDEAFVRIREVKVGGGWTAHNELRLSIDERDEDEDDETIDNVNGIPFILHPDIVSAYGLRYIITLDEDEALVVTAKPED